VEGGPAGAIYGVFESEWMEADNFLSWFRKLFLPAVAHLTKSSSVYLLFDGHHSHISLELIRVARENNVKLFCLPPNCTHIVQPLDVGVFGPMKKVWARILKQWKLESRAQNVSKEVFPSLLRQLWDESLKPEHCKSAFRACGIFPLCRRVVLDNLAPSEAFTTATTSSQTAPDHISCDACGHEMRASPFIRKNLRRYFRGVLEVKTCPTRTRCKNRVRIEGEVITSDEFLELLEKEKQDKQKKSAQKETILPEHVQSDMEGKKHT